MYHLKDHKINSVTSLLYGKSPCDGVGGKKYKSSTF